ncbi:MAG TPA: hypothetical protein VIG75_05770 [Citricoccus sp.]
MNEHVSSGKVVAALVEAGLVEGPRAAEARAVVERELAPPGVHGGEGSAVAGRRTGPRLTEVVAYAGAALVVVAIVLLGAQYWGEVSPAQRSLILAGIALVLLAGALVVVRVAGGAWAGRDRLDARPRFLAGTLVTAASVAAGLALGSWILDTFFPPPDYDQYNVSTVAGVGLALVVLGLGYALAPSVLLHLGLALATVVLLLSVWTGDDVGAEILRAVLVLAAGALWLTLALVRRGWSEPQLGGAVGALLLFLGSQLLLAHPEPGWAHAVTFVLALGLFGLYWWRGWWPFLAVAVLALTTAVTEALVEWTDGSLGAGGAVLVAGLVLLAASGGAMLLRQRRHRVEAAPAG